MASQQSIEYPGYYVTQYENTEKMDTQEFYSNLIEKYRDYDVLHILSYHLSGKDWWTGQKIKEDKSGFEVIWRYKNEEQQLSPFC